LRIDWTEIPTDASVGFGAAAEPSTTPCPNLFPQKYLIFQASNLKA
jgi:hypothetical protein